MPQTRSPDAPATDPPAQEPAVSDPPTIPAPAIVRPDEPDLPDREWSRPHARAFLASRPQVPVYIPLQPWQQKGGEHVYIAGWNGHNYAVPMGKSVLIPDVIAEIIEGTLDDRRTVQSRNQSRYLHDIGNTQGPEIPTLY